MNSSKTFRLFISSTFSDFKKEREVLQKDVFPHIKEYALSKGYTFQPIDLRWGVSSEAQLDQKTLELCLDEVRSCKSYPHPNFLLMLGDRYGWVPLPYAIEKDEFELISSHIRKNDKKTLLIYEGKVSSDKWFGSGDKKGLKKLLNQSENDFRFRNVEEFVDKNDNSKKIKFIINREIQSSKLLSWYELDENQLPASYILKERQEEYEEYDIWVVEENTLREVLQTAVENSCLNKDKSKRSKYFTSATEAEIIEGIVPYKNETKNQEKLSKELKKIDAKHVFGFLRNITSGKSRFSGNDDKAKKLKDSVREIIKDNVLDKNVKQINQDTLDESYLKIEVAKESSESLDEYLERVKKEYEETFECRVVEFLKIKIDEQNKLDKAKAKGRIPLLVEKEEQEYFAKQKRESFLITSPLRTLLDKIKEYTKNKKKDEDNQPFIIHGSSGSGKSSLIAKAIEEAKEHSSKKIIYRFVGATPNSGSSKEILTSIFDEFNELGIDITNHAEKKEETSESLFLNSSENEETFEKFSYRIKEEINNLNEEVVIFIDAVDQLTNEDQFLWIPNELPSNVKIVFSALDDEKYEDTQYFKTFKNNRIGTRHLIPEFNKPGKLLRTLLCKQDRTIQKEQMKYFLKQYRLLKTPLYVTVAAQEMKHWKSYDDVKDSTTKDSQSLANTQKDIIGEFIKNLSELYHHNKVFVQKVLGYIYASKDGLSESELLQLIATDEEFVKQMAPETWHENPTKELPIVHWSRLYTQLKPFLSSKTQDGEELMYFFHREFEDVMKNPPEDKMAIEKLANLQKEHEDIIKATQILIEENQDKPFDENRWGKLYANLIAEYELRFFTKEEQSIDYEKKKKQIELSNFLVNLKDYKWVNNYLINVHINCLKYKSKSQYSNAMIYIENYVHISKVLYNKYNEKWYVPYGIGLSILAYLHKRQGNLDKSILFNQESLKVEKGNIDNDIISTITTKINLAQAYAENMQYHQALNVSKENIEFLENDNKISLEHLKMKELYVKALSNLAYIYRRAARPDNNYEDQVIPIEEKVLGNKKELFNLDNTKYVRTYTVTLHNLAVSLEDKDIAKAISNAKEAWKIRKKLYEEVDPDAWVEDYCIALNTLARLYLNTNDDEGFSLAKENLSILTDLYQSPDALFWVDKYFIALRQMSQFYIKNNNLENAVPLIKESIDLYLENYFHDCEKQYERTIRYLFFLNEVFEKEYIVKYLASESRKVLKICKKINSINSKLSKDIKDIYETTCVSIITFFISHYKKEERFNLAIDMSLERLEIVKENDSITYASALHELSKLYDYSGNYEDALEYEKKAIEQYQILYNENSVDIAKEYTISLNELANLYLQLGNLKDAIETNKKCLDIRKKNYYADPKNWFEDYAITLNNLAGLYFENTYYTESLTLLNILKEITINHYGENSQKLKEVTDIINLVVASNANITIETFLCLAKYFAHKYSHQYIGEVHFAMTLSHIDLNDFGKHIFSQLMDLDSLHKHSNARSYINLAKNIPSLPYEQKTEMLVLELKKIFGNKIIGSLR